VIRQKKAKKRPAKYQNRWVLIAAIRLLQKHVPKTGDDAEAAHRVIIALRKMGRGEDARLIVGQTPGRGGNRKSETPAFDIALAYEDERANGLTVANACAAVRTRLHIGTKDSTIRRIARANREEVQLRRDARKDFDEFGD
jgi:hypothetical protein